MTSFTLWLRLKECYAVDECIQRLGEMFNSDKPYISFPSHITLVPSITNKYPNMEQGEIMNIVEKNVKEVKEELGNGK